MTTSNDASKSKRSESKKILSQGLDALGVPTPERVVFTQFASMPLWVRVVTYLIFVALVVHGYLVPRVISGTVDELSGSSRFTAYPNSIVSVIGDRSMRYFATGHNDGTWSIPVPKATPTGFEIEFAEKDNLQSREKIQVCATDVLLGRSIPVRYHPAGSGAKFTRIDKRCQPAAPSAPDDAVTTFMRPSLLSPIRMAMAQSRPVQVSPPDQVEKTVANAIEHAGKPQWSGARTDAKALAKAAESLNLELKGSELASVRSDNQASQLLQEKYYAAQIGEDQSAVYLFAGEVNSEGNWAKPPNISRESSDVLSRPFRAGDVVVAQNPLNKRADYIQLTLFGWRNAESLGIAKPGDHFVVRDSKNIGSYVWVKAVPVELKREP